jgi:hypothetical protein
LLAVYRHYSRLLPSGQQDGFSNQLETMMLTWLKVAQ